MRDASELHSPFTGAAPAGFFYGRRHEDLAMYLLAERIEALFEEALSELDRLARLELERVGQGIQRWLQDLWPRLPCDTCVAEFNRIVANFARDQVFIEEESQKAFIAWLSAVNASAAATKARRMAATNLAPDAPPADESPADDAPVLQKPPADRLSPRVEKVLREVLAQIEKLPPDKWLEEVRKLLDHVDLPPEIEARILEYYTRLHELWERLHRRGPIGPAPAQELLFRIVAGLDKLIVEGRMDELIAALRELVQRIPELMPAAARGGELEKLAGELHEILNQFLDLLELLPPEAGDVAIEMLQLALDIAGMFPGPGDVLDVISAIISARRGEWLDAITSVGSAIFLAGILAGIAKISKRLKKLASLVAKLKGPVREILSNFTEGLAKEIEQIPLNSVHAAIEWLKGFVTRLRKLLDEAIEKLQRSRIRKRVRTPDEDRLLNELQAQGIKHSPDRIIRIGRNHNGKIIFLEEGDAESGLSHILAVHGGDFAARGILRGDVPDLVFSAATEGKLIRTSGSGKNVRNVYEVIYHGKRQRIAVGVSTNGYIVTAFPD